MAELRDEVLARHPRLSWRSTMPLDADLLELLACPSDDHAPLREETRDGATCSCARYCASTVPGRATASRCCCSTRRRPGRTGSATRGRLSGGDVFDEAVLDDADAARAARRARGCCGTLATAGAQVRRAVDTGRRVRRRAAARRAAARAAGRHRRAAVGRAAAGHPAQLRDRRRRWPGTASSCRAGPARPTRC